MVSILDFINVKKSNKNNLDEKTIGENDINNNQNKRNNQNKTNNQNDISVIKVFTDGACIHNGKKNAKAGYGVYFGENDPRNTSESYSGKQTNNVAEMLAIIKAMTILRNEIEEGVHVKIFTDSVYSMRCCSSYGEKCYKKYWSKGKIGNIPNEEIVQAAYIFCRENPNIEFVHVLAHTGKNDAHSIGNHHADRLANEACGVTGCPYDKRKNKIYLTVPFEEKEEAKKMGARW